MVCTECGGAIDAANSGLDSPARLWRGRPRQYCSDACRVRAYRKRRAAAPTRLPRRPTRTAKPPARPAPPPPTLPPPSPRSAPRSRPNARPAPGAATGCARPRSRRSGRRCSQWGSPRR
ncbi:hypothetical protein ACU686_34430 [Yinghuangia aomiensis]